MSEDYSKFKPEPTKEQFLRFNELVEEQANLELQIAELEEGLQIAKQKYKELSESTLPELMEELGQEVLRTTSGISAVLDEKIRASISKANNAAAIKWLDDNGHSGIVKRKFEIRFNKEDQAWANKFAADLAKRKKPVMCEESKTVHTQTLGSFVRNQLEEGVELPLNLFGVHRQKVVKLKVKS